MVFTDTLPISGSRKKKEAVAKAIKVACRSELPPKFPFEVYHHPRQSNNWLQVADYCTWSIFRKWEGDDPRTYQQLSSRLAAPELDVLRRGTDYFY
jgi:hypothetical protein